MLCFDNLVKSVVIYQIKGFSKIHKTLRTEPCESRAVIQVWRMATRACVVDLDLRQPNWQLSRCGSMKERNHFPTIDSNTLAMVGRRYSIVAGLPIVQPVYTPRAHGVCELCPGRIRYRSPVELVYCFFSAPPVGVHLHVMCSLSST